MMQYLHRPLSWLPVCLNRTEVPTLPVNHGAPAPTHVAEVCVANEIQLPRWNGYAGVNLIKRKQSAASAHPLVPERFVGLRADFFNIVHVLTKLRLCVTLDVLATHCRQHSKPDWIMALSSLSPVHAARH